MISQVTHQTGQLSVPVFLLRAAAWIVGLFAFVRIPWVQDHLLIPFARLQHGAACALTGAPRDAVVVDLSCTGADVMAVTMGALLSFPMAWKRRWLGGAIGLSMLVFLNTARIGALSWVVERRELFELLHLRLFPLLLVLAATAFVLVWVRQPARERSRVLSMEVAGPLLWVLGFTLVYFALAPVLYGSSAILQLAEWITAVAARLMIWLGAAAEISGNRLVTDGGIWLVTQECVLTPLIPAYLGLVWGLGGRLPRKLIGTALALPLFSLLGMFRLLILALPESVLGGAHLTAVHAFYQVLLAVVVVLAMHWWRKRRSRPTYLSPGWALGIGGALGLFLQWLDRGSWLAGANLVQADPQGVTSFLPAFMLGMLAASSLVLGGRRLSVTLGAGAAVVGLGLCLRLALSALAPTGFVPHPLVLRLLGVAVPVLTAWLLRRREPGSTYLEQWTRVGEEFPDLGRAASTAIYRRDEQLLLDSAFPTLEGVNLLKTDLWDEARNTRILQWAAAQGAQVCGIDISLPTVLMARREFARAGVGGRFVVADVRDIPLRDRSFTGVYSMGTVEHFDDTEKAVAEIARVTDETGRIVLGVPNRRDPFLRPLLVGFLRAFGLYRYGAEKCYSHAALRRLCTAANLRVDTQSGILFQPGWLRMLDLALHTGTWKRAGLLPLVAMALKPFAALSGRFDRLRRHGYLIAAVCGPRTEP